MSVTISLHVLSVVIWVGGMFFAYVALRPVAASLLQPPQRLALWVQVFGRFFPWVWVAVITLLLTGYWMIFVYFGGMQGVGVHVHLMHGLGVLMMLLFVYVFFAPYQELKHAVDTQDWSQGGKHLGRIRRVVGINTMLGLSVIVIAAGGRYT